MTDRGDMDAEDPGDLAPELLTRLQELLLDARPPVASVTAWDDTLAHVLEADAPLGSTDLVPDQTTWAEIPADASAWDDGDWSGDAWASGDGWKLSEDTDWPGPDTAGDDDFDEPDEEDDP